MKLIGNLLDNAGFITQLFFKSIFDIVNIWKRKKEMFEQIEIGTTGSFLVILLISIFTGLVVSYQTGIELKTYSQESMIGSIVAVSLFREMAPVMTAFVLAGLLGTKIAAEIGTMKVSEEIDALLVMSIDPVKYLVLPRIFAMLFIAPILTIWADIVGFLSGGVIASTQLSVNFNGYISNASKHVEFKDFYAGIIKSIIFGGIIGAVAAAQGLKAEKGAEGVGIATMKTVVISSVLVLMFDWIIMYLLFQ